MGEEGVRTGTGESPVSYRHNFLVYTYKKQADLKQKQLESSRVVYYMIVNKA